MSIMFLSVLLFLSTIANLALVWITNLHIDRAIEYLVAERRAWEAEKLDKEIPD